MFYGTNTVAYSGAFLHLLSGRRHKYGTIRTAVYVVSASLAL